MTGERGPGDNMHSKGVDTYNVKYEAVCIVSVGVLIINYKRRGLNPATNHCNIVLEQSLV